MGSPNIKDLLTSFSPSSDFLAVSSGDGRIKIWDTLKGHLQTDFADITLADDTGLSTESESGHLSLDYRCMKWMPLEHKKKRNLGYSLLVLGTGGGDVLALDVAAGQLRWRACDCHPGGVNAISFSEHGPHIYTAGVDGMVCQIDSTTGSLVRKFRSSTKALSSISISPDGKILATAAGQLKIFSSDFKKMQKFSGHPAAVRCMIFTEDGKYILSSAVGERYIAVWKIDGGRKQPVSCVLSMDHPAVFLDSKGTDNGGADNDGLVVLAISELGLCYFWHGRNVEELRSTKPTKISLSLEGPLPKYQKSSLPTIFAAKLQGIVKLGSAQVSVAYGSVVKPSFEKLLVQHGVNVNLSRSQDGVLLPMDQSSKSKKRQVSRTEVTALDRANAEDAMLPIAKLLDYHEKKRKHSMQHLAFEEAMADVTIDNKSEVKPTDYEDDSDKTEEDAGTICMEDRLRSSGLLGNVDDLTRESFPRIPPGISLKSTTLKDNHLWLEAKILEKKIKEAVLAMSTTDAYKFLTVLVTTWKLRPGSGKYVLPWIRSILANHSHYAISQEPSTQMLGTLHEMTELKCSAIQPLLQLSGHLKLISTQINKAGESTIQAFSDDHQVDESGDEDEDIVELIYGEEEGSESGSDAEN
eukprot:TRINITY_DN6642_c0_g1_i2.p1 TRINITY_DN6642_c0_g1~~TRINITY_DN6642_c0_g1_i2.p1  ORF type:complete len:638 (-),score=171.77 TRINITY_DN6642_c0_g1_i2:575-2488(-)